jgi:acyl-coenzyme A thioesterase PaaI-like protein
MLTKTHSPFIIQRKENAKSKFYRYGFNIFPSYRRSGGRVQFISSDWREMIVSLKLKWSTRNIVGTVFGGSIYAAVDPIFMFQLMKLYGKNYVVWDKAANIRFLKPIKKKVFCRFLIEDEHLTEIDRQLQESKRANLDLICRFEDQKGNIYAEITKTLYVADKSFYKERLQQRQEKITFSETK